MTRAPTDRSHLSIGEVLSLLQEEFPDVTISKIRFLESQGLLDPERTPSGYRKFYEGDIERLRKILTLQKDHYLPLKVIKARLDEPEGIRPAPTDAGPDRRPAVNGTTDPGTPSPGPGPIGTDQGSAVFNEASSILGVPAINLPLLAVDQVPLGVQLLGRWHEDERLTAVARWLAETHFGNAA